MNSGYTVYIVVETILLQFSLPGMKLCMKLNAMVKVVAFDVYHSLFNSDCLFPLSRITCASVWLVLFHMFTKNLYLPGTRPPPLLRRSSFPIHIGAASSTTHQSFTPKEHVPSPSGTSTPTKSTSRRTSVDGSEDDSSPDMAKRRVRFLRRHWSSNETR
jgi:hypothetical protein